MTSAANTDTLEEMLIVLEQVEKGAPNTLIGAGIPASLAYVSDTEAIRCALAARRGGADMIYSSGNSIERFKALSKLKIPCVGHVGLVPDLSTWIGGLRPFGKTAREALQVHRETLAFQEAGAIAVEMECVPYKVAAEITKRVDILTFSMGSGSQCDGQFLFSCDILGAHDGHYPRHSVRYCDFFDDSVKAFRRFREETEEGVFPGKENVIEIKNKEFELFMQGLARSGNETAGASTIAPNSEGFRRM